MRRHVIVGGGIAGLSAAEALRAVDSGADITLIGAESHPFYSRPGLAYLLAGEVPERQLTLRSAPELRELALDRVVDQVTAIDTAAHTVTLAHHEPLGWDRLLIATGAAAVAPDFPGAELDGVVQLGSLGDARRIIELSRGASAAVVVGGGPTAVELAEGLAARGLHVHYLLRGGRYFADVLDVVESRLVEEALQRQGIELHHHTRIGRVLGKAGRVSAVETATGAILPCRLVAVATGVRPRLEMARAAGLSLERGVVVDERLGTSAADVLAAGDVAQLRDPDTGVGRVDALWSSALAAGRAAGQAMAGATQPFRPAPSLNVTRLGHMIITIVGAVRESSADADEDSDLVAVTHGDSEGWRVAAHGRAFHEQGARSRVRVLVGERRVVGAVIVGDAAASRALCRLIHERTDVSALRPQLLAEPDSAVTRLVALGLAARPGQDKEPQHAPRT